VSWPVVLDTDIGTDVDDALALGVLLGCPDADLVAVTVTYGDTGVRAAIARRLLQLAGRDDVPLGRGDGTPLTPGVELFWLGHEGDGVPGLAAAARQPTPDALAVIDSALDARPGAVDVAAIGPLATIARALDDRRFAARVGRLWLMGGDFGPVLDEPEHNWRLDPVAAHRVLGSGLPLTITGIDQTLRCRLDAALPDQLEAAGSLGGVLAALLRRWWDETAPDVEDYAHDAITVLTALHPDLFEFMDAALVLDPSGGVRARRSPGSNVRVVVDYDVPAVRERIVEYLLRASAAADGGSPHGARA
jgi:purine nucleosidase